MVEFDTTFLTLMFVPGAKHPIANAKERIEFLIRDLHGRGDQIVVPTPALSEMLVKVGHARDDIIKELTKSWRFLIAPFDLRAAVELAMMTDSALTRSEKRDKLGGTWTKVKFDRQIVAIGKVLRVSRIYSEDNGVHAIGKREGIAVHRVADIEIADAAQTGFTLTAGDEVR